MFELYNAMGANLVAFDFFQPTLATFTVLALIISLVIFIYAVTGRGFEINIGGYHAPIPDLKKPHERMSCAFASVLVFALFLRLYAEVDLNTYMQQMQTDLAQNASPMGMIDINLMRAGTNSAKRCALANYVFDQFRAGVYPASMISAAHADQDERQNANRISQTIDGITGKKYCFADLRDRLRDAEIAIIEQRLILIPGEAERVATREIAPLGPESVALARLTPPPHLGYVYLGRITRGGTFITSTFSLQDGKMPHINDHLNITKSLLLESDIPDPASAYPPLVGVYRPNTHLHVVDTPKIVKHAYVYALVEPTN